MGLGECFTPCLRLLKKGTSAQDSHLLGSTTDEKFKESIPQERYRAESANGWSKCPELVPVANDNEKFALLESIVESSPYAISIHDLLSGKKLVCNAASRAMPGGCVDLQVLFAFDPGSLEDALSRVRNSLSWRGLIPVPESAIHEMHGLCLPETGAMSRPSLSIAMAPNLPTDAHASALVLRKAIQLAACPSLMRQQGGMAVSEAPPNAPIGRDLAAHSVPVYSQQQASFHRQFSVNDSAAAAAGTTRSSHLQEPWTSRGGSSVTHNATATAMLAVARASRAVAAAKAAALAATNHSAGEVAATSWGTGKQLTEHLTPNDIKLELLGLDTSTISTRTTPVPSSPALPSHDIPLTFSLPQPPSIASTTAPCPDAQPPDAQPHQLRSSVPTTPPGTLLSTTFPHSPKKTRTRRPDLAVVTDISESAFTHVVPVRSPNTPATPGQVPVTSSALISPFQTAECEKVASMGTSPCSRPLPERYGRSPGSQISFGRVSPVFQHQREGPAEARNGLRRSTTQLPHLPQQALLEALTTSTWSTRLGYRRCKSSKRLMLAPGGGGGGIRSSCGGNITNVTNRRSTTGAGASNDARQSHQHTPEFPLPPLPTELSTSACAYTGVTAGNKGRALSGPPASGCHETNGRDGAVRRSTGYMPESDGVMDSVFEDDDCDAGNGNGGLSSGDGGAGGRCGDAAGRPAGATGVLPRMLGLVTKVSTRLPAALPSDRRGSRMLQYPQQQQQQQFQSGELTPSAMAVEMGVVIGNGEEERGSEEESEGPGHSYGPRYAMTSNGRVSWNSTSGQQARNGLRQQQVGEPFAVATVVMGAAQQRHANVPTAGYEAVDASVEQIQMHTSSSRPALIASSAMVRHSAVSATSATAGPQIAAGAGTGTGAGLGSLGVTGDLPYRKSVDRSDAGKKGEIEAQVRVCVPGEVKLSSRRKGGGQHDVSDGACEGLGSSTVDEEVPAERPAAAAVEDGVNQQLRVSTELNAGGAIEMERWHEVVVSGLRHPLSGAQLVMVTQHDVSARVWAEQQLARVMEAEHALLEAIFPAHVLEHITVMAAASAEATKDATVEGVLGAPPTNTLSSEVAPGGDAEAAVEMEAEGAAALALRTVSCTHGPTAQRALLESQHPMPITGDTFLHLATSHTALTILFCDIQGFTSMCNVVKPATVMAFLNDLYTRLDAMLDAFGVYKVETIGDCYVAAGGLMKVDPDTGAVTVRSDDVDPQHAHRTVQFAKALLRAAAAVRLPTTGEPVRLRVGIHSGPAMSGVVGTRMPRFCLFGDTINTASRMESTGLPGAIHVSQATRDLLPHEQWEPTGGVEAKGKGVLQTYLLRPPLPG